MADGFVHTVYKNDQWVNEIERRFVVRRPALDERRCGRRRSCPCAAGQD
jgi:hypothetical protein